MWEDALVTKYWLSYGIKPWEIDDLPLHIYDLIPEIDDLKKEMTALNSDGGPLPEGWNEIPLNGRG